MNEVVKVPFCGDEIMVIEMNGKRYVAMRNLVLSMGLNWTAQYEKLHRDPVLNKELVKLQVLSKGGPQTMICLGIEFLNGWLFKIPSRRYTGARRKKIIKYQKQCYQALAEYFHSGGTVNPNINSDQLKAICDEIERKTMEHITKMFEERRQKLKREDPVIVMQNIIDDFFKR